VILKALHSLNIFVYIHLLILKLQVHIYCKC